jgi:hypothetical protein
MIVPVKAVDIAGLADHPIKRPINALNVKASLLKLSLSSLLGKIKSFITQ